MPTYASYGSLLDRVVLITGGGSGIGAAIVEQFVEQGSRVAFLDINEEAASELTRRIAGTGRHDPLYVPCDLTNIPALKIAVDEVNRRLGSPVVLVNNAGNDDRRDLEDVTVEYWDQRIAINLRHYFFAAQAVADGMKKMRQGSIINLSSIAWMIPTPHLPVYATAKAAILGLSRSLSLDLGRWEVRVNAVLPGAILTERQRRLWLNPEYETEVLSRQHLKRHLQPEEVARLILFLAADDSAGITGQQHFIDAGWI